MGEHVKMPSFQVRRFKTNLGVDLNEPMADALLEVLDKQHEQEELPVHLHAFMEKLYDKRHDGYKKAAS